MIGTDATNGKRLDGLAHLRQSIADIITTPIGSRVMRRTYGSLLMTLIDQPATAATNVRLFASIAESLMRWEPRIRVRQIGMQATDVSGRYTITLDAQRVDVPTPSATTRISIPLITRQTA